MAYLKAALAFIGSLAFAGCCEIEQLTLHEYDTLLANPIMVFVDSVGNSLVLDYNRTETRSCSPGTGTTRNNYCESSCEYKGVKFNASPDWGFGFSQIYEHGLDFNNGLDAYTIFDTDTNLVIQGETHHCLFSFGGISETGIRWAYDSDFGILLIEKEGQFRWERVLNP